MSCWRASLESLRLLLLVSELCPLYELVTGILLLEMRISKLETAYRVLTAATQVMRPFKRSFSAIYWSNQWSQSNPGFWAFGFQQSTRVGRKQFLIPSANCKVRLWYFLQGCWVTVMQDLILKWIIAYWIAGCRLKGGRSRVWMQHWRQRRQGSPQTIQILWCGQFQGEPLSMISLVQGQRLQLNFELILTWRRHQRKLLPMVESGIPLEHLRQGLIQDSRISSEHLFSSFPIYNFMRQTKHTAFWCMCRVHILVQHV